MRIPWLSIGNVERRMNNFIPRRTRASAKLRLSTLVLPYNSIRTPRGSLLEPLCSYASVSKSEVSKFSQFSKTWWDPRENPLVGMNTIRMDYIVRQTSGETTLSNSNALDVGCGGGLLSESLARLGAQVTAIDPSEVLIAEARRHAALDPRTRSIDYRGGWTVEKMSQETDTKFDIVCLLEVIEHVTDPDSLLRCIKPLLKPRGKLFVSTMNRTLKSKIVAIFGAEYVMRYLPVGTHSWDQFLSPGEVEALMQQAGFNKIDVTGIVIDSPPLHGKWSWRLDPEDTDVNWIGTYQLESAAP